MFRGSLSQSFHRTGIFFLLRPGRLVDDGRRRIRRVSAFHQLGAELFKHPRAQKDHHRRAVTREGLDGFPCRHRCAAGHAGDDHALGDSRQRGLHVEGRSRAAEGAHARRVIVGNLLLIQNVHLLPDRAVNAGIAGVKPHSRKAGFFRVPHHIRHFLKRHFGAVTDAAIGFLVLQKSRIHQGTRVNNDVRLRYEPLPSHCDQVRRPGPRSHKMDHNFSLC